MALIKEGDRVKRRRYKKDSLFLVEKIVDGFAFITHERLPIHTVEPVRELELVEGLERIQNSQNNYRKKRGFLKTITNYISKESSSL